MYLYRIILLNKYNLYKYTDLDRVFKQSLEKGKIMQISRFMTFSLTAFAITAISIQANAGIIKEVTYPKTINAGQDFKVKLTIADNVIDPGTISTYSFNDEKKYSINGSIL